MKSKYGKIVKCKYEVYDYDSALRALGGWHEKLIASNNTWLRKNRDYAYRDYIGLILYKTEILRYYPKGESEKSLVLWRTGGWDTRTTVQRLNQFSPPSWIFRIRNFELQCSPDAIAYQISFFREYEGRLEERLGATIPSYLLGWYNQPGGYERIRSELVRISEMEGANKQATCERRTQ